MSKSSSKKDVSVTPAAVGQPLFAEPSSVEKSRLEGLKNSMQQSQNILGAKKISETFDSMNASSSLARKPLGEEKDIERLSNIFKKVMMRMKVELDSPIPIANDDKDIETYFTNAVTTACALSASSLSAECQILRNTALEIKDLANDAKYALAETRKFYHDKSVGPVLNKTIAIPSRSPSTIDDTKMAKGLERLGESFVSAKNHNITLSGFISDVPISKRRALLEEFSVSDLTDQDKKAIFLKYKSLK